MTTLFYTLNPETIIKHNTDFINLSCLNKLNSSLIFVKISYMPLTAFKSFQEKQNIPLANNECLLVWYLHQTYTESWEIIKKDFLDWIDVCYLYKFENTLFQTDDSFICKCLKYSYGCLQSTIYLIISTKHVHEFEKQIEYNHNEKILKTLKHSKYFYSFANLIYQYYPKETYDDLILLEKR